MSVSNSQKVDPALLSLFPDILKQQETTGDELRLELSLTKAVSNIATFEKSLQTLAKTANLSLSIAGLPEVLDPILPGLKKNLTGQIKAFRYLVGQKAPTRTIVMNLTEFLQSCPNLATLDLSQCGTLSTKNLLSLIQAKPKGVTDLNISTCKQLKSEDLESLAYDSLRSFSFADCPEIVEEALIRFLDTKGQALEALNLSKSQVTSSLCSHLPATLKRLFLEGVTLTYDALSSLLERHPQLSELAVGYPENLGSLKVLTWERLQHFITPATAKMPAEHVKFICTRLLKGSTKPDEPLAKRIDTWAQSHSLTEISEQCQKFYKVVQVLPPTPPPQPTPAPKPQPLVEEIQYDVIEKKSNKDRSLLTLKVNLNIRPDCIPEGPITLKIDLDTLALLEENSPTLNFLKTHLGNKVDKLLFMAPVTAPNPKCLALLANVFPKIRHLKLIEGSQFAPQFVKCFSQTLHKLHIATPMLALDAFKAVVDECPYLQTLICKFAFPKEAFVKLPAGTLLRCMLIDIPTVTGDTAEVIIQSYLSKMDSLVHPVRKQVMACAIKYKLQAPLVTCLQMLNHESPCALVVDESLSNITLFAVGLKPDSPKWKEVEETLDHLYSHCNFAGTMALEVDAESLKAGSKPKLWLDQVVRRFGKHIRKFKGEKPDADNGVSASTFLAFAEALPQLQAMELVGVTKSPADELLIERLTKRLEEVQIDEFVPIAIDTPSEIEIVEENDMEEEPADDTTPIVALLYSQQASEERHKLIEEVSTRAQVPLEFLTSLLAVSENNPDLLEPCIRWINTLLTGWIQCESGGKAATMVFSKQCLPAWLSERTSKSVISILEFLVMKMETKFRLVYYEEFDSVSKDILDVIRPATHGVTVVAWELNGWEALLSALPNLSQVTFTFCNCSYSQIALLLDRSIDVHYDEVVSGIGEIAKLTTRQLVLLFSSLIKDEQTKLLDEALPVTHPQFAKLLASGNPELERYAIARFNAAFKTHARFETAHALQLFPTKALTDDLLLVLSNIADASELNVELADTAFHRDNLANLSQMLGLIARAIRGLTLKNPESLVARKEKSPYAIHQVLNSIMACYNMTRFSIENSDIISDALISLPKACPKVMEVRFVNCPNLIPSVTNRLLKEWLSLAHLSLAYNRSLTDHALATIVEGLSIQQLELTGCVQVTDAALKPLSALSELQTLTLAGCASLTFSEKVVFAKLEKLNLAQCKQVKKEGLAQLFTCNSGLRSVSLSENPHLDSTTINLLASRCKALVELDLSFCYQLQKVDIIELATLEIRSLRSLDIECCTDIDEATLKTLLFFNPHLSWVNVCGCPLIPDSLAKILLSGKGRDAVEIPVCKRITDTSLNILTFRYPNLQRVQIEHSPDLTLFDFESALRRWEELVALQVVGHPLTSDRVVSSILKNARGVTELQLAECGYLTDGALVEIAQSGSKFRHLSFKNGKEFTNNGLEAILQNLAELERLEIVDCAKITLDALQLPTPVQHLRTIKLINCPKISNEGLLRFVACCPYLVELTIMGCSQITADTLNQLKATSRVKIGL